MWQKKTLSPPPAKLFCPQVQPLEISHQPARLTKHHLQRLPLDATTLYLLLMKSLSALPKALPPRLCGQGRGKGARDGLSCLFCC
jgi:hypothetical protein